MGKYGIDGNSGFVAPGLHIAAPYDSTAGHVFVEIEDEEVGTWWKRVPLHEADNSKLIRCSMCRKPAVSLDHYWPYYIDRNRCAKHYDEK